MIYWRKLYLCLMSWKATKSKGKHRKRCSMQKTFTWANFKKFLGKSGWLKTSANHCRQTCLSCHYVPKESTESFFVEIKFLDTVKSIEWDSCGLTVATTKSCTVNLNHSNSKAERMTQNLRNVTEKEKKRQISRDSTAEDVRGRLKFLIELGGSD